MPLVSTGLGDCWANDIVAVKSIKTDIAEIFFTISIFTLLGVVFSIENRGEYKVIAFFLQTHDMLSGVHTRQFVESMRLSGEDT